LKSNFLEKLRERFRNKKEPAPPPTPAAKPYEPFAALRARYLGASAGRKSARRRAWHKLFGGIACPPYTE
jgi:hypothetical protein